MRVDYVRVACSMIVFAWIGRSLDLLTNRLVLFSAFWAVGERGTVDISVDVAAVSTAIDGFVFASPSPECFDVVCPSR